MLSAIKRFIHPLLLMVVLPSQAALGFGYQKIPYDAFTTLHILSVPPQSWTIAAVRAQGAPVARETVESLADQYHAVAAINGGFWRENGRPAGLLRVNGQTLAKAYRPRAALGWTAGGQIVRIDRLLSKDRALISQTGRTTSGEWERFEHIVGGAPVLLATGVIQGDFSAEMLQPSFTDNKHARTAVGIRKSGEWVFLVAEAAYLGRVGGLTLMELASIMQELGCQEALNLDGGSSSTMVVEGRLVTFGQLNPPVSDAILILPIHPRP